jgi:hypothetical protein
MPLWHAPTGTVGHFFCKIKSKLAKEYQSFFETKVEFQDLKQLRLKLIIDVCGIRKTKPS